MDDLPLHHFENPISDEPVCCRRPPLIRDGEQQFVPERGQPAIPVVPTEPALLTLLHRSLPASES